MTPNHSPSSLAYRSNDAASIYRLFRLDLHAGAAARPHDIAARTRPDRCAFGGFQRLSQQELGDLFGGLVEA